MAVAEPGSISMATMADYLGTTLRAMVDVVALRPLGTSDTPTDPKQFGYGVPFEVECLVDGVTRRFVVSAWQNHFDPEDLSWLCGDDR